LVEFSGALRVSVMRQNANAGALRDGVSASGVERLQMVGDRCAG
jgi:hypothetical protein